MTVLHDLGILKRMKGITPSELRLYKTLKTKMVKEISLVLSMEEAEVEDMIAA